MMFLLMKLSKVRNFPGTKKNNTTLLGFFFTKYSSKEIAHYQILSITDKKMGHQIYHFGPPSKTINQPPHPLGDYIEAPSKIN
jgi:hypothetical protein